MIIVYSVMFAIVLGYNWILLYIIQTNLVSIEFHEYQVKKKEVESILNINLLWRVNQFYTFSSFRSGVLAMYFRIYFNLLALILVLMEVSMVHTNTVAAKITAQMVLLIIFTIYCFVARPYRTTTSNWILCLGMVGLSMQVILI